MKVWVMVSIRRRRVIIPTRMIILARDPATRAIDADADVGIDDVVSCLVVRLFFIKQGLQLGLGALLFWRTTNTCKSY